MLSTTANVSSSSSINVEPSSVPPVEVSRLSVFSYTSGVKHSLILAQDELGRVRMFACGSNDSGQLGTGNRESQTVPVEITHQFPSGFRARQVCAGINSSFLIGETSDGVMHVYKWGNVGEPGGDASHILTPENITANLPRGFAPIELFSCDQFGHVWLIDKGLRMVYPLQPNTLDRSIVERVFSLIRGHSTLARELKRTPDERVFIAYEGENAIYIYTPTGGAFRVMAKGDNWQGRFGMGHTTDQPSFVDITHFLPEGFIPERVWVSEGSTCIAGRDQDGYPMAWVCGANQSHKLGIGSSGSEDLNQNTWKEMLGPLQNAGPLVRRQRRLEANRERRGAVAGGYTLPYMPPELWRHIASFLKKDDLLSFRTSSRANEALVFEELRNRKMTILNVASGGTHTLVVAKSASGRIRIYACGWGGHGQLGTGRREDKNILVDITTSFPEGFDPVEVRIAAGWDHSLLLAIERDGSRRLFSWGGNYHGQLGIGNAVIQTKPIEITAQFPQGFLPEAVGAGQNHSYVFGAREGQGQREVYLWGFNRSGQLGNGITALGQPLPQNVTPHLPDGFQVHSIAAGDKHTLFLGIDADGISKVFACGSNEDGQLARDMDGNSVNPIDITPAGFSPSYIHANSTHSLMFGRDAEGVDRLYIWGNDCDRVFPVLREEDDIPAEMEAFTGLPAGFHISEVAMGESSLFVLGSVAGGAPQLLAYGDDVSELVEEGVRVDEAGTGLSNITRLLPEGFEPIAVRANSEQAFVLVRDTAGNTRLLGCNSNNDSGSLCELGIGPQSETLETSQGFKEIWGECRDKSRLLYSYAQRRLARDHARSQRNPSDSLALSFSRGSSRTIQGENTYSEPRSDMTASMHRYLGQSVISSRSAAAPDRSAAARDRDEGKINEESFRFNHL